MNDHMLVTINKPITQASEILIESQSYTAETLKLAITQPH